MGRAREVSDEGTDIRSWEERGQTSTSHFRQADGTLQAACTAWETYGEQKRMYAQPGAGRVVWGTSRNFKDSGETSTKDEDEGAEPATAGERPKR